MLTVLTLYQRGGPSVFSALCFYSSLVFHGSAQRRTVSAFELYLHWGLPAVPHCMETILDLQEFGEMMTDFSLPVWQPPLSSLVPNATVHTSFPGKGFSLLAVQLLTDQKSSESEDSESLSWPRRRILFGSTVFENCILETAGFSTQVLIWKEVRKVSYF